MYVIYYIYHNETLLYIGSSKDIADRKRHHKSECFNENGVNHNKPLYKHIRENNIEWDALEWRLEQTEITNLQEILEYETKKQLELKPIYNPIVAKRSQKERYEINKETIIQQAAEWAANNPERRKEIRDNWRKNNAEKEKESKRKYREANREKLREANRVRYAKKKAEQEAQQQNA
jgi:hypothetical protein